MYIEEQDICQKQSQYPNNPPPHFSSAIIFSMIFITGGTGFIGSALIQHLNRLGMPVRVMLRPSGHSPNLPKSIPMDAAICTLQDQRALKAALKNIEVIYHLASDESKGSRANLTEVDIEGTSAIIQAAKESRVKKIIYLSHLGAAPTSAFPVLRAKGIAENLIIKSGIPYTILRSSIAFGKQDHFTTSLASLIQFSPIFFLIPGDGSTLLQPIWIDDLINCLVWVLNDKNLDNQVISIGGPEYLQFIDIVELIMKTTKIRRKIINTNPINLKLFTIFLEQYFYKWLPVSSFWMDYLSTDRIASIDTLPRLFNLLPARMAPNLSYLLEK